METSEPDCPLCAAKETAVFFERRESGLSRIYLKCFNCFLIFLSPIQRLSAEEEKKHYNSHRNDPKDKRYLNFLSRLADPLSLKLAAGAEGLDFGCGPGPAMSLLFRQKGFLMEDYDPFYFPDASLLKRTYDFAACSEVIEHFREPGREFLRLNGLLKKRGFLGVMTCVLQEENSFSGWWYPKDPTHICFYQQKTLEWIAARHGWSLEFFRENVMIFEIGK